MQKNRHGFAGCCIQPLHCGHRRIDAPFMLLLLIGRTPPFPQMVGYNYPKILGS
jgi:hypothetical protein